MNRLPVIVVGLVCVLLTCVGCGTSESESVCEPGEVRSCPCQGEQTSTQKCLPDGSGWGDCQCGNSTDDNTGGGDRIVDGGSCDEVSEGAMLCERNFEDFPEVEDGGYFEGDDGIRYYMDGGVLRCEESGTWEQIWECPGREYCIPRSGGSSVGCGNEGYVVSYAEEGTSCIGEGSGACSFDQTDALMCQRGEWIVGEHCGSGDRRCERLIDGENGADCPGDSEHCIGCAQ